MSGVLKKFTGNEKNVLIPDEVTEIGEKGLIKNDIFQGCDCLINIPEKW